MTTIVGVAPVVDEGLSPAVSWGAVIAGGIASAALTLLLLAFGVGVGFSVVSPWSDQGISASTFHITAGVYLIVVAMMSSAIGGFLAGRLRNRWAGVHSDEVYFRDTAHGFLAWAFATVLGAIALGSASTHILGSVTTGLISAAGATATGPTDIYVDRLLRSDRAESTAADAAANSAATRAELGRLLAGGLSRGGDVSALDQAYAARVVSARTGLTQPEAEKRVTEVVTQAKAAADEARKAAAKLSLWLAASMLAGALAAALAATEGGVFRDSKWFEPGWRKSYARG